MRQKEKDPEDTIAEALVTSNKEGLILSIAEFLGLHPHTVAKGRRELVERDIVPGRTRKTGAGRKPVVVSHYPAGASKWSPIEHRMFSEISKN